MGGIGKGYLTVYLALSLTVMLSMFFALLEGARYGAICLEAECITEVGFNSILAEYHRELYNRYNLFAIDSSYGSAALGRENVERHLTNYLTRNMDARDVFLGEALYRDFLGMSAESVTVEKARLFTDEEGAVFRRRAAEACGDEIGLGMLEQVREWMQTVDSCDLDGRDVEAERSDADAQLNSYDGKEVMLDEENRTTVQIQNPVAQIDEAKARGVLRQVLPQDATISGACLVRDGLLTTRAQNGQLNQGNLPMSERAEWEEFAERFLFQEYLLKNMGRYGSEPARDTALQYELEYILFGKDGDADNLRSMAGRLLAVREAANAIYLFGSAEKRAEAEAVALVITGLLLIPEAADVVATILLLAWSYAESVYDVRSILAGARIPLIKTDATWHYSLQGILQNGVDNDQATGGEGLSYEDYLRIFLMMTPVGELTGRAMDLVEANIRLTPGNASFRLDGCYDCVEATVRVKSGYGYDCELTRRRGYFCE